MSNVNAPYGLRPVQTMGGQPYNGSFREFKVAANNSAAIFNGDLVVLSAAGLPSAVGSTPVAIDTDGTATNATAGIVGVCVGARYITPASAGGQPMFGNYLPANTITNGYTDVWVRVMDDPDALFRIQGSEALGTFNSGTAGSGWPGAIGKNTTLTFNAGSTTTGKSGVTATVGTNGGTLASTLTLAVRIVDVVRGTESQSYPEFIVKYNLGVHSYYNPLGV